MLDLTHICVKTIYVLGVIKILITPEKIRIRSKKIKVILGSEFNCEALTSSTKIKIKKYQSSLSFCIKKVKFSCSTRSFV